MESLLRANAVFVAGHEDPSAAMALLERAGRASHASEDRIGPGSADKFIRTIVRLKHESVLEHHSVTVLVSCDRGTSHQWVRHRLGSYTQQSQRYVEMSECRFVDPEFRSLADGKRYTATTLYNAPEDVKVMYRHYYTSCLQARQAYSELRKAGASPEDARAILPNGTETLFYVTYNLRQWRHFFQERCSPAAHHIIRRIASELLSNFIATFPACFEDLKSMLDKENIN